MAEVVDSIVADLVLKGLAEYEAGFNRATAAHGKFQKSVDKLKGQTFDIQAEGQKYRQGGNTIAQAAEQTDAKVTRSRKKRTADSITADEVEVRSAKKAAAEKVAAEEAAQARATAAVERGMAKRAAAVRAGSGHIPNSDLSRGGSPLFIPAATLNGGATAEVAATGEVDRLTRDIAINKARLVGLEGQEREELQREIAYLETYNRLKRAGVAETEAQVLAEKNLTAVELRQAAGRVGGLSGANQFALAASGGRLGYSFSPGAVAGIAVAAGATITIAAVEHAVEFAKALKADADQLGITTRDLQVYRAEAERLGVSQEQLTSSLGQFSSNLGRAQEGAKEQSKIFRALNVDIGNAKTGFRSASEVLPDVIDRLSSLQDHAQRAAVETALFGESGRKLDGLLSGGTDAINSFGDALDDAGHVLSDKDIQDLNEAAVALSNLKQQLNVDLSRIVANNADAIVSLANAVGSLADRIGDATAKAAEFHRIGAQQGGWLGGAIGTVLGAGVGFFGGAGDTGRDSLRSGRLPGQLSGILHPDQKNANSALLNSLFAPDGHHRRGKSAETLERQALDRQRRFQDELSRFQDEQLRAQESLTGDINKRADYEKQLADRELARQVGDPSKGVLGDIDIQKQRDIAQGEDAKLAEQRASQLKAEAERTHALQIQNIEQGRSFDLARAVNDTDQRILQQKADHLQNELALATTSAERRRIELELLANSEAEQRARLQGVIDTNPKDSPQVAEANAQLKALPGQIADQRAGIMRETESSLETYRRTLQITSDSISDFGVRALQGFNSELDNSITKALHLHGVFGQIVADLLDMAIKQQVIGPLANSGGFGGFLGSIGKLFGVGSAAGGTSSAAGVFGSGFDVGSISADIPFAFANGGAAVIGGRPGVDQNIMSINGVPQAKLSKGELLSVVNPNLGAMNQKIAAPQVNQTAVSHYHITVRAENSVTPAGFGQGLAREILAEADRMDTQRQRQTLTVSPHRIATYQNLGN